jgi:hypothetical protein
MPTSNRLIVALLALALGTARAGTFATPTATTVLGCQSSDTHLATTQFVQNAIGCASVANQTSLAIAISGGTVTLTTAQLKNAVLIFTGSLAGNVSVVLPTGTPGTWSFVNNTSGAFTATMAVAGQMSPLAFVQGSTRTVSSDGATLYGPVGQALTISTPTSTATGDVTTYGGVNGQSLADSGYPIGASGHALASLDGANTWSGYQTFTGGSNIAGSTVGSMLINGDMDIDQQFEGQSNGVGIDRWYYSYTAGSGLGLQRITGLSVAGYGHYLSLTAPGTAVTVGSTDQRNLRQIVEGSMVSPLQWGTINAQAATLQFWAYATLPGTYCFSISNSTPNESYVGTFAIASASTWQMFTETIPAPPLGSAWSSFTANQFGLMVRFDVGSGSSLATSSVGVWQAGNVETTPGAIELIDNASAQLSLVGVHLFAGTNVGPYIPRPYADELALAKRFYAKTINETVQVNQDAGLGGALCTTTPVADSYVNVRFALPNGLYSGVGSSLSITTYNPNNTNASWRDVTQGTDVAATVDPATAAGGTGVEIETAAPVAAAGDTLCIHATMNSGAR